MHFFGSADMYTIYPYWHVQVCWGGYQRDLRAYIQGGARQGVTLLAGGAVGEIAHRVQRLLGSTRCDNDFAIC